MKFKKEKKMEITMDEGATQASSSPEKMEWIRGMEWNGIELRSFFTELN